MSLCQIYSAVISVQLSNTKCNVPTVPVLFSNFELNMTNEANDIALMCNNSGSVMELGLCIVKIEL